MSGAAGEITGEASADVLLSIQAFLARECPALGKRRFRDWLDMFADDGRYEVPVRVTREQDAEWEPWTA